MVNRRDLARIMGVAMNTVDAFVDRGMPVERRGGRGNPWAFDVVACFRWRLEYEVATAVGASTRDITLADAERRKTIAAAILAEIKVSEQLRSVVKVEDVARIWEGRIVSAREAFIGIPQRLAPLLVGESDQTRIEEQIGREITRALEELAERPDADESGHDGEPDAKEPA